MRRRIGLCALAFGVVACGGAGRRTAPAPVASLAAPIYVVRHAEKAAAPADDPPLTERGQARAAALARVLHDAPIGAVIVTQRQRTALTAAPTVLRHGATLHVIAFGADGMPAHAQRVADSARALAARTGRGVLVVGHSNTVGLVVRALGGPVVGELCDSQHATLFSVLPQRGGVATTRASYGAADPVDPACEGAPPATMRP